MPNPISYSDIADYQDVVGVRLTGFEVNAIRRLDRVWFTVINEARRNG